MKQISFLATLLFILAIGCSSRENKSVNFEGGTASYDKVSKTKSSADDESMEEKKAEYEEPSVKQDSKDVKIKEIVKKDVKKIIKTAAVSIEVVDYKNVKQSIRDVVEKWKGYISRENEENNAYKVSNSIDIRVPSENFEKMSEELVALAKKLDYKRVNATDVTDEYYDTQTRLESNRKVEQSYLDLLKRANSIGDILDIQAKLGQIREEIESKEGRIKRMDDQVAYSTISLTFYELHDYKYIPEKSPGFFARMARAIHSGWEGFVSFFIALFYLWPLWLITGVGVYILLRFLRRKKK